MINFGIDLGTTNSAIAKFEKGKVEIFRNPISLKQTLPSVIAFRKNRIIVGDKAREYLEKDPNNVVGLFKRKMGTSETYLIESTGDFMTPINLSAYVLKELKNFIHTGEQINAAVVTIPASFDTIQSNATKKAGYEAGFDEVVLLQEPIAASLAYANKEEDGKFEEGMWLVYDLGGGTFDVALVKIKEGEMKIIDHEGDNFLGGTDFDKEIVEKLVIPYLESEGKFENLEQELKSAAGKYNKLYQVLLHKAEEAKVILSNATSTEIEFEATDDNGKEIEGFLTIERQQFENILAPFVDKTAKMITEMLERNSIEQSAINFVLMVGGSTYIPYVRERIGNQLSIAVNCNIDPTTAVALGAAYYAGTKPMKRKQEVPAITGDSTGPRISIKTGYQKSTQDEEEVLVAQVDGDITGLFYRIIRQDGGFDSGLKPLTTRINEELPLLKNSYNYFNLNVYDDKNNQVATDVQVIGITQGRYSVAGQPLPNDICLEIDDIESGQTALDIVFEKNAILPTKRTIIKEVINTIKKGSDDKITINVVEGPSYALPSANQPIGFITISGKELERDLIKGSDVEVTLEMSESRDLKINAFLMLTNQEFENVFTPSERHVNVTRLNDELVVLLEKLNAEIQEAEIMEDYRTAQELINLKTEMRSLIIKSKKLTEDDITDEKFQIEDQKRKAALLIDSLTSDKRINAIKMEYFETKKDVQWVIERYDGSEAEKSALEHIINKEKSFLASNSPLRIKEFTEKLYELRGKVRWRDPEYVISLFYYFASKQDEFTDKQKGAEVIKVGEKAIEEEKYDKLRVHVNQLYSLLPEEKKITELKGGTGIG